MPSTAICRTSICADCSGLPESQSSSSSSILGAVIGRLQESRRMERFQSQYGGKRRNCSAVPAIAVNGTRQCPVASEQWFWQRYRALPHGGAARTSTRRCSCVDASRSPTHRFRRESTSRWSACRCVHAMHRGRPAMAIRACRSSQSPWRIVLGAHARRCRWLSGRYHVQRHGAALGS